MCNIRGHSDCSLLIAHCSLAIEARATDGSWGVRSPAFRRHRPAKAGTTNGLLERPAQENYFQSRLHFASHALGVAVQFAGRRPIPPARRPRRGGPTRKNLSDANNVPGMSWAAEAARRVCRGHRSAQWLAYENVDPCEDVDIWFVHRGHGQLDARDGQG